MNFLFLTIVSIFLSIAPPAQALIANSDKTDNANQSTEDPNLTLDRMNFFLRLEEENLKKLEQQHEENLKNLPDLKNLPEGHEKTDEIRKLSLFIIKMMLEGNYETREGMFGRETFRTYFGERSYGHIEDFLKENTDQTQNEKIYYLLETHCVPKVEDVDVGKTSKRWTLNLVADYVRINNFDGSLLVLESDFIDHSQKWDKTRLLITMDIRNRLKDNGKDKYQFRNVYFKKISAQDNAYMEACSKREKLLHEISLYDVKSIKSKTRIKFLNKALDIAERYDLDDSDLKEPNNKLDLDLPLMD